MSTAAGRQIHLAAHLLALVAATPCLGMELGCSGRDDDVAIHEALEKLGSQGGGVLTLVGPEACVVRGDVELPLGVRIRGRGAVLTAAPDADFSQALLVAAQPDVSIESLSLGASNMAKPAIAIEAAEATSPVRLRRVRVQFDSREATIEPTAIFIDCGKGRGSCVNLEDVHVECRGNSARGTEGVRLLGGPNRIASAQRLTVSDCGRGFTSRRARTSVRDSVVRLPSAGATGFDLPADSSVSHSRVIVPGEDERPTTSSIAIRIGPRCHVDQNDVELYASTATGIHAGPGCTISGNHVRIEDASKARGIIASGVSTLVSNRLQSKESPATVGVTLRGSYNVVAQNFSGLSRGGESTHVLVLSEQNVIDGNNFAGADWGVRPPIFEGGRGFTNGARLTGNNFIYAGRGCAVFATGWHATGNHCSWVLAGAGFWFGSPGPYGTCSGHTLITDNTLHTAQADTPLVRFAASRRCVARQPEGESTLAACTAPKSCPSGLRCVRTTCNNITIADNMLMSSQKDSVVIDMFGTSENGWSTARAQNIQIVGNTLATARTSSLVRFRPDQGPNLMRDIIVAGNLPRRRERLTGWRPVFGQSADETPRRGRIPPTHLPGARGSSTSSLGTPALPGALRSRGPTGSGRPSELSAGASGEGPRSTTGR